MRDVAPGMADTPRDKLYGTVGHLVEAKQRIWLVRSGQVVTHLGGTVGSPAAARICLGFEHLNHSAGLWGPSTRWQSPDCSRVPASPAGSQPWGWQPGL